MLKLIPDSHSDLEYLLKNNYVYIDKTMYIKNYENLGKPIGLFLRPRRFGKTMFTEILRYYYDIALKDECETLLKDTYILKNPTPLKNSYAVVNFSFIGVNSNGTPEETRASFSNRVTAGIYDFYARYPDLIPDEFQGETCSVSLNNIEKFYKVIVNTKAPCDILSDFLSNFNQYMGFKFFVIIDEYDNFTNDVLSSNRNAFIEIARKQGFVSNFYNTLRAFNESNKVIERIFVTGVLPVTMDTAFSGFVCAKLTNLRDLNELAGFTSDEIDTLIDETVDLTDSPLSKEDIKQALKSRYNGYRFSKRAKDTVHNSTLCLNFINDLKSEDFEIIPEFSISSNVDIDYTKLSGYLNLINEKGRKEIIDTLSNNEPQQIVFPGSVQITSSEQRLSKFEGLSLLYHLGFVTYMSNEEVFNYFDEEIDGEYVKIPNEYFRMLFNRYILTQNNISFDDITSGNNLYRLSRENNKDLILNVLAKLAGSFVNSNVALETENLICTALYSAFVLNAGNYFELTKEYPVRHNGNYIFTQGPDKLLSVRPGRADLVALNRKDGPSYIFEFKYKRETRSGDETKESVRSELFNVAREQLDFYVTDDNLKQLYEAGKLHKYVIMYTYGEFFVQQVE